MFYTFYRQYGNKIILRYKTDDHRTESTVIDNYKPTLYMIDKENKDSEFKSIFKEPLKKVQFDTFKEAKEFAEKYKHVPDMGIQGNSDFANQFIIEICQGQTAKYDASKIRYCLFDIEVDSGESGEFPEPEEYKWPITFIALYDNITDTFTLCGLKNSARAVWSRSKCIKDIPEDLKINNKDFDTEEQLLRYVMQYFQEHNFDFTSGWNSEEFDMPYLTLRSMHLLGEKYVEKMMSPFGKIEVRHKFNSFGVEYIQIKVEGVPHLDYLLLYKKHIKKPRENYKLGYIAQVDTGRTKVEYEGSLHDLYINDYQLYGDYNLVDTFLIREIEKVNGLFSVSYALMYYTLSNLEDTMGTVKIWEKLMAKYLYSKSMIPPYHKPQRVKQDFEGGFVYEPKLGRKSGIVSYDLQSLYPHCEMQYNIGPETYVSARELPKEVLQIRDKYNFDDLVLGSADLSCLKKHNLAMAGNFEFYRRDELSVTSAIKREIYTERKQYKKKMLAKEAERLEIEQELTRRGIQF